MDIVLWQCQRTKTKKTLNKKKVYIGVMTNIFVKLACLSFRNNTSMGTKIH